MKTFNKEDLITWYNRDQAKIGERYIFADSLSSLKDYIQDPSAQILDFIDEDSLQAPFICRHGCQAFNHACILPVDKVIEKESEKKFRPLKNIEEMYELIFGIKGKSEEDCIYELISDCILHLKSKKSCKEYYTAIRSICKNEGIQILINSSLTFEDLFNEFEIELNGEWLPFGIEE